MPKGKKRLSFLKRKKLNIERLIKCGSLKNSAVINLKKLELNYKNPMIIHPAM